MFFGSRLPQGVATHLLPNQAVMNFRGLRNIEAAFFIPAWFVIPSMAGVPNLWYAYHWRYAKVFQVVRELLPFFHKNLDLTAF